MELKIREVTSDSTITQNDSIVICNSTDAIALSLQSATGSRDVYYVKNSGAGTVTLTPTLPDLMDGGATYSLLQYEAAVILDYKVHVWVVL